MEPNNGAERVEQVVREYAEGHCQVFADSTWLIVRPDRATLREHGWKLHVSARPATFPELVDRLLPILIAEGCVFKLARSPRVLARLNDGGTVLDVHARGVVIRDLKARNVVVDGDDVTLIDFGVAGYQGLHIPGGTPGWAPARQFKGEPPRDTDDLHSLGMTLLYATSGVAPFTHGGDPDLPRRRALQTISAGHGASPRGVMGAVADLLGPDHDVARGAARRPAAGATDACAASGPLPAPPKVTDELAAEITENLLADLLDQTGAVLAAPGNSRIAHDASIYTGSAGIGLELLEHRDLPGVAAALGDRPNRR